MGSYAQTELGHGSDVANLETTATYDMKTDEFVIQNIRDGVWTVAVTEVLTGHHVDGVR